MVLEVVFLVDPYRSWILIALIKVLQQSILDICVGVSAIFSWSVQCSIKLSLTADETLLISNTYECVTIFENFGKEVIGERRVM